MKRMFCMIIHTQFATHKQSNPPLPNFLPDFGRISASAEQDQSLYWEVSE